MRKLVLTCLASGFFAASGLAQTLFTYGSHPVSKEQFLRVYDKNSINKKPDYSDTALRSYLDLYALFRMKVAEADLQHLDTTASIERELDTYRKQLSKNYLTDDKVTNALDHEAYDRMKQDIHVEHILILCPPGADTVAPYRRIDSIYHAIVDHKADFETLAKEYSEDRGSKEAGGNIGYITSLETVYPFENAIYATPVGKVSAPFRTQFGFHIVKILDKRPAVGEVKVAQILIESPKSKGPEGDAAAHARADSVEMLLRKGVPFEELVKKYSDDKFSVKDDGVIPAFGVGRMVPPFEKAAFALKRPGDVSEPVKTDYGYHIIKLLEKTPLKPYDSLEDQIKHKVSNDSREQHAKDAFFTTIKEKNGFKEYPVNLQEMVTKVENHKDTGKMANTFHASDYRFMDKPLFRLGGKDYLQNDFAGFMQSITRGHLTGNKGQIVRDVYKMYVDATVNDFEEHKLVDENPDFKNLMEEYRDGIMLFELMDRNVWSKASKDTIGLKAFYDTHKSKYMWEPGFEGVVYHFKNEASMKEGVNALAETDGTDEAILKRVNNNATPDGVTIQHGRYEFSKFKEVPQSELVKGKTTKATKNDDGSYTVVKVTEVYNAPMQKSLDDARGYVVAEYQDYLEKEWNDQLRKKYPVKVEEKVFRSMVK